jgi:hypothetical protein
MLMHQYMLEHSRLHQAVDPMVAAAEDNLQSAEEPNDKG